MSTDLWWLPGLGTMLSFTAMALLMRAAMQDLESRLAATVLIGGLAAGFLVLWLAVGAAIPESGLWWLWLGMVFGNTVGNLADFYALKHAPNPGYSNAIKSGQILLVTLVSAWLLAGVGLNAAAIASILAIVAGIFTITGAWKLWRRPTGSWRWVLASFTAMGAFALTVLCVRAQFDRLVGTGAVEETLFLNVVLWGGTFLVLLTIGSLRPGQMSALRGRAARLLVLSVIAAVLANGFDYFTVSVAPNPGYATALKGAQILPITLIAPLCFREVRYSASGILGVVLVACGLVGLVLSTS